MEKKIFKTSLIAFVGFLSFLLILQYANNFLKKSKASENGVVITMTPNTGTIDSLTEQSVDIIIQANVDKKISGIDLYLNTASLEIVNVVKPIAFTGSSTQEDVFTEITKEISQGKARLVYVSKEDNSKLSSIVKMRVTLKPTVGAVEGNMNIDTATSKIVGTATGNQFTIDSADKASFVIKVACLKSKGDVNCDGKVDLVDFELWRREFVGELTTLLSDLNVDNKVDLIDFEIWRQGFFSI